MGNRDVSDEVLRAFAVGRIFILETLSTASFGSKVAVTNVAIGSMDRQRVDFYLDLRFPYDFAAYSIDEDCSLPVGAFETFSHFMETGNAGGS
jgi:hypothetical protein